MKKSQFTEAQIVGILRKAEKGEMAITEICRVHGIAENAFCRWRRRYGDLQVSEVRRLRELEAENARLKRLLAKRDLELDAIRETMGLTRSDRHPRLGATRPEGMSNDGTAENGRRPRRSFAEQYKAEVVGLCDPVSGAVERKMWNR